MPGTRRQRLPPRLSTKAEIDAIFRGGVRVHGSCLTIVGRAGERGLRFAVPCGKRFSKRAVDRNRFRRVAREVVRTRCGEAAGALEFVVLPRCKPADVDFERFAGELPELLRRLARRLSIGEAPPGSSGR